MKKNALGLYLSETTAQAVVIERIGSRSVLAATREWENTLFDYAGDDTPGMDEFVDHLGRFLKSTSVAIQRSGVALDTSLLFLNTIPFETTTTDEDIHQHIQWELREYFPGLPPNAFISDTHTLARHNGSRFDSILAVSVRRDLISKLRRGLEALQLRLDLVDSDHFSADTLLRMNYPEATAKSLAIVGIKSGRFDISILRSSEVESYSYYSVSSPAVIAEKATSLTRVSPPLNAVFVYGMNDTQRFISDVRAYSRVQAEQLSPFRSVEVPDHVRHESNPEADPCRYTASVGVALRQE